MTNPALKALAHRLVTGVPDGAPAGALPPLGVVLGVHTAAGTHLAVAGDRSVSADSPMTTDTVHDLASVTKIAATTMAVMRLVSQGLLSLDLPASAVLPAFSGGSKNDITVRDLLAHSSGMAAWWPLYLAAEHAAEPSAAHAAVDGLALTHRPGSSHHYSDLGFIQLGRIVAHVSGLPLPLAVRTLVHEPLGVDLSYGPAAGALVAASALDDRVEREMIDSGVPYPVPFASTDFRRWRTGIIVGQAHDGNTFHALGGVSGHAGLFGTVPELLSLSVALGRAHEHEAIWAPAVVEEFFTTHEATLVGGPHSWRQALGFRRYAVRVRGREVIVLGHPGFVGAAMAFVPGTPVAVALGTNRLMRGGALVPTELLLREVLHVALGATSLPASVPSPS